MTKEYRVHPLQLLLLAYTIRVFGFEEIEMARKLTNSVYCEVAGLRGCNHSFAVTSEGIVMMDTPQYPGDAIKWRNEIGKYGKVR